MYNRIKDYFLLIFSFLENKPLVKHVVLAGVMLLFLFFLWLKFLHFYTLHDNYIKVPNYIDVHIEKVDSITNLSNLRYVVIDTIFDAKRPKGIVVNQNPDPFTDVKKKRRIYLTINSLELRKVLFPNIYDLSLRQAIRELKKIGLEVGELQYRADIATNKILDFKVNGIGINEGQELYVGTIIDLVVGKGLSNKNVIIPNLIGLNRVEANIILKTLSLNIGSEIFDSSVIDSASAIIYQQYPLSDNDETINIGSSIDLYFQNPLEIK